MKLIVLILSMINVSLSFSYKCKDDDVMSNNSCWTKFSAVVGEYQNITTWLKPTQSSHSVVISDTLFSPRNRTIKLGESWFSSGSWNRVDIRVIIKEISKSKYELQYFIDGNKLEVRFPFETDTMLQSSYGLKWKFNGLWNISTNFNCLNFNATNATSLYNGTVPCSSFRMSGNNINKNCSCADATKSCPSTNHSQIRNLTYLCTLIKVPYSHLSSSLSNLCSKCNTSHICQKSSDTKLVSYNTTKLCPTCNHTKPCPTCNPTKLCPTCNPSKPCPDISNNATKCLASNQTKSNLVADSSPSQSCPNDTSVVSNNLKNEKSHAIIYVALVIMVVGALSLVAGFLQYRKAMRLRKISDYEEFHDDNSQNGTLENDSGRISYGSNLSQRIQYNELVDKDNLQRTDPESCNARNFSISSELDAEDVYNPIIMPLSR